MINLGLQGTEMNSQFLRTLNNIEFSSFLKIRGLVCLKSELQATIFEFLVKLDLLKR